MNRSNTDKVRAAGKAIKGDIKGAKDTWKKSERRANYIDKAARQIHDKDIAEFKAKKKDKTKMTEQERIIRERRLYEIRAGKLIEAHRKVLKEGKKMLTENCWAFPRGADGLKRLKSIMSQPIPASAADRVLYDIIGDDKLFDDINEFEDNAPTRDVRGDVCRRIVKMIEDGGFNFEDDYRDEIYNFARTACKKLDNLATRPAMESNEKKVAERTQTRGRPSKRPTRVKTPSKEKMIEKEKLDELSTKTLNNYVKKADVDNRRSDKKIDKKLRKNYGHQYKHPEQHPIGGTPTDPEWVERTKSINNLQKKIRKRRQGISTAYNKLGKDNLNELSSKKMRDYSSVARRDKEDSQLAAGLTKSPERKKEYQNDLRKRTAGLKMANKKMANEENRVWGGDGVAGDDSRKPLARTKKDLKSRSSSNVSIRKRTNRPKKVREDHESRENMYSNDKNGCSESLRDIGLRMRACTHLRDEYWVAQDQDYNYYLVDIDGGYVEKKSQEEVQKYLRDKESKSQNDKVNESENFDLMSEEEQLKCVYKDPGCIKNIDAPSEKVMLIAVRRKPSVIKFIKNPTTRVKAEYRLSENVSEPMKKKL